MFWLFLIFGVTQCTANNETTKFTRTNVTQDNVYQSTLLESTPLLDSLNCALLCTGNQQCRRFMFCEADTMCSLYLDGTDCTGSSGCVCYLKKRDANHETSCPIGYYGNQCENIYKDCQDGYLYGHSVLGKHLTTIKPTANKQPFTVLCNFKSTRGQLALLWRLKSGPQVNFNRSWAEYEEGFGNEWNGWIGFNKLLQVMNIPNNMYNLKVEVKGGGDNIAGIYHDKFLVNNGSMKYSFIADQCTSKLNTFACIGDPSRDFVFFGQPFSTYDSGNTECAARFGGGWWFEDQVNCTRVFLTGTMDGSGTDNYWLNRTNFKSINLYINRDYGN